MWVSSKSTWLTVNHFLKNRRQPPVVKLSYKCTDDRRKVVSARTAPLSFESPMMSPPRKASISGCLLILIWAHRGLSLALPTVTPIAESIGKRADTDIATAYGVFFDSLNSYGKDKTSSDSDVAHLPEVFMAIAQQTDGSLMSPLTVSPGPTPTESLFEVGVTAYPTAPPVVGPGVVLLSTQLGAATPLPTGSTTVPSSGKQPSRRGLILGSVIGSLLLFTLFLFVVLDPVITGKLCGICFRRRKPVKKKLKEEHKEADTTVEKDSTWVDASPVVNTGDDTFVDGDKLMPKIVKEEGTLLDPNTTQPKGPSQSPPSKFSMCSSEYSESPRNSALSSNSAYTSTVRKSTAVSFMPGAKPLRPPRPPTVDSPALSESVYLANACAEQPYVVVAPQPITEADMKKPPRRIMTPSEFFALHAPSVLASFSSSSSKKHDTSIPKKDNEQLSTSKRESFHSRTKSAPLLGPAKTQSCTSNSEFDSDTEVAFQAPMIQRIAKHRRSRSASGWAYPDRPGSRNQVRGD